MDCPRILIAGVSSGVGKTTLTLGIMAALSRRGLNVQPFKVGPDYIDPGLHFHACGTVSHNLDSWMGGEEVVKTVFCRHASGTHVSVIEGVMGLYDGVKNERMIGSSAHIAMMLQAPVILVVNVKGMGQSCIPLVKGYIDYEPLLNIRGIILNYAGSAYYQSYLKNELEQQLGIKVLGCLPRDHDITMPQRHLGLVPAEENQGLKETIQGMADMVETHIDLAAIIRLAQSAPAMDFTLPRVINQGHAVIGVAKDEAFSFYYQDNLDYLRELGGEIVFFSPLRDQCLPAVDGLYIGGGFPEMFLGPLGSNDGMIASLRRVFGQGIPILAECGGFMYLAAKITDFKGVSSPGAGLVPGEVKMKDKLAALGYVRATALNRSIIAEPGDIIKGHEFHYSEIEGIRAQDQPFTLAGGKGRDGRRDGYVKGHMLASYVHIHFRSNPETIKNYLDTCRGKRCLL